MKIILLILIFITASSVLPAQQNFYFGLNLWSNKNYSDKLTEQAVKSLTTGYKSNIIKCIECDKHFTSLEEKNPYTGISFHLKFYPVKKVFIQGEVGAAERIIVDLTEERDYPNTTNTAHISFVDREMKNIYYSTNQIAISTGIFKIGAGYQLVEIKNEFAFTADVLASVAIKHIYISKSLRINQRKYPDPLLEDYYDVEYPKETFKERISQITPFFQSNFGMGYRSLRFLVSPTIGYYPAFTTEMRYIEKDGTKKQIDPLQMEPAINFWFNFSVEYGFSIRNKKNSEKLHVAF